MARRRAGSVGMTPLELKIMQVLWRAGPSSVQEVRRALDDDVFAYTTVQTILNILHRKGHVTRRLHGRKYAYRAAVTEEKTLGAAMKNLIDRMFSGSPENLVMSLVKTRQLDITRLARLTERIRANQSGRSRNA